MERPMLRNRLSEALKEAMKAKEARRVSTLRLILAALKDRDIQARTDGHSEAVPDEEILAVLQKMIKQRRESIEHYEAGGRLELAQQEQDEIAIIQQYLPTQLTEAETEAAAREAIGALGAAGIKDMGRVMARLKERHSGEMDFGKAGPVVKRLLTGG
jgi:uncharacterized protein YqeY